jgi:hypothetical protein
MTNDQMTNDWSIHINCTVRSTKLYCTNDDCTIFFLYSTIFFHVICHAYIYFICLSDNLFFIPLPCTDFFYYFPFFLTLRMTFLEQFNTQFKVVFIVYCYFAAFFSFLLFFTLTNYVFFRQFQYSCFLLKHFNY